MVGVLSVNRMKGRVYPPFNHQMSLRMGRLPSKTRRLLGQVGGMNNVVHTPLYQTALITELDRERRKKVQDERIRERTEVWAVDNYNPIRLIGIPTSKSHVDVTSSITLMHHSLPHVDLIHPITQNINWDCIEKNTIQ